MPLGTPYNGQYGEVPPERGTMFRLQVYDRVTGISLVGVYERVGKSVISVCKKFFKGLTDSFCGLEEVAETFWFCDLFIMFKDSTFTAVERDAEL